MQEEQRPAGARHGGRAVIALERAAAESSELKRPNNSTSCWPYTYAYSHTYAY